MDNPTTPPTGPATPAPAPASAQPAKPIGGPGRSLKVLTKLRQLGVHPDFPLFPHAVGQWAKKVKGKLHYFGALEDPTAALALWQKRKDDLIAGRTPRPDSGGWTVRSLTDSFLTYKRQKMDSDELTSRSFQDYYSTCIRFREAVGPNRAVVDLRPEDFNAYRAKIAARWGTFAVGNEVQRVRSLCKYAIDMKLIDHAVDFGPGFKKPDKKARRIARAAMPPKILSAGEIRLLLDSPVCSVAMKAMILLGMNCGYGNTDVAQLQKSHLDLRAGIAVYPRPKTAIGRRATLWPETVKAIKAALKVRPAPKNPADAGCVFVTKYGERWKRIECAEDGDAADGLKVRRRETDSVGLVFGRLLRSVKIKQGRKSVSLKRDGINFYVLRHVFRTVAGQTGDIEAVNWIMGHIDEGMGEDYREWELDTRAGNPRLRKVADCVHDWLFGNVQTAI